MFEMKARDGLARIGILETRHGRITTPALLPVINPHYMVIEPKEMLSMGAQAVITNAYIIYKDKNLREEALKKGLHSLLSFNNPIMTDSGSFQMYVYGKRDMDADEIVRFQNAIESDIGTILDIFSADATYEKALWEVKETIKRARRAAKIKGDMLLAATVQGGVYDELRSKAAKELAKINADVYPIGGVVPLMENQRFFELARVIIASKKFLPPSKPVHLFGAGHPMVFPLATLLGCDLFDSSSYIKYAKDDRFIFQDGTYKLSQLEELPCSCPICSKYSIDELKEMNKEERTKLIAYHNLWQSFNEIKKVKQAIKEGSLWELVERKATLHPSLMEAMEVLKKNKKWLEKWENISKKRAFMYTGKYSIHRPIIYRLHKRLMERYIPFFEKSVVVEERQKPYSRDESLKKIKANVIVNAAIGPIPIELDEIYPVTQSIFPRYIDGDTKRYVAMAFKKFYENMAEGRGGGEVEMEYDIRKIMSIADYQFGKGASQALFNGEIKIVKSKATGKIRNVYCNGKHVVSMRAADGFFTLKLHGARALHSFFPPPKLRVVVAREAIPFIRQGKNVFAKFVIDCDDGLRPYDEALIVSEDDELIAVGQAIMNREEMMAFERGIAVKTREGVKRA